MPPEQHDGENDGLLYKKIFTRHLPPDHAIIPPPQGQPATNPVTTPAPKPANLPLPDSPLMKSINQQLRVVKEAQELQEGRVKAHEEALAKSAGALTVSLTRIDIMQNQQTKNK